MPGPTHPYARVEAPHDVFVSYSRLDRAAAETLTNLLRAFGQRVFLDRDSIAAGQSWQAEIRRAAMGASTLILIWSRNAVRSEYISKELQLISGSCRIIPISLDRAPLPDGVVEHQGFEGLQLHERVLARSVALTRDQSAGRGAVVRQILDEIRQDGYDLTPDQEQAVAAFVFHFPNRSGLFVSALWCFEWLRRQLRLVLTSPKHGTVSSILAALAFGGGYLFKSDVEIPNPHAPDLVCEAFIAQRDLAWKESAAAETELASCRHEATSLGNEMKQKESAIHEAELILGALKDRRAREQETARSAIREVQESAKSGHEQREREQKEALHSAQAASGQIGALKSALDARQQALDALTDKQKQLSAELAELQRDNEKLRQANQRLSGPDPLIQGQLRTYLERSAAANHLGNLSASKADAGSGTGQLEQGPM